MICTQSFKKIVLRSPEKHSVSLSERRDHFDCVKRKTIENSKEPREIQLQRNFNKTILDVAKLSPHRSSVSIIVGKMDPFETLIDQEILDRWTVKSRKINV
jgi:hypothetical protein